MEQVDPDGWEPLDEAVRLACERFELALDGVTATRNIAQAGVSVRYDSQVLSRDETHVVVMVPIQHWLDLEDHIEMFLAYMAMEEEQYPTTEGE